MVNKDYENKKEEFIKLVNHEAPSEISFSDKNDDPLDSAVMNNLLDNMMQSRERDLNQIHPEKESNKLEEQTVTPTTDKTNKIDSNRKVTFAVDDFISKLKKHEDPKETTDIQSMLNIIITNQRSNIAAQEAILNQLITLQAVVLN